MVYYIYKCHVSRTRRKEIKYEEEEEEEYMGAKINSTFFNFYF